jgi:mannose-6-phosphate isomerase-like protein (cupin superfamily)
MTCGSKKSDIQTYPQRIGEDRLAAGEMFVVPKGVEHKPFAARETKLLLIEPRGVPNTGEAGGDRTAQNDVWI